MAEYFPQATQPVAVDEPATKRSRVQPEDFAAPAALVVADAAVPTDDGAIADLIRTMHETTAAATSRLTACTTLGSVVQSSMSAQDALSIVAELSKTAASPLTRLRAAAFSSLHLIGVRHGARLLREAPADVIAALLSAPESACGDVARAFLDADLKVVVEKSLARALPQMIVDGNQELVRKTCECIGQGMNDVIISHLHNIFAALFLYADSQPMERAIKFLHTVTGSMPSELLHACLVKLLAESELIRALGDFDGQDAVSALEMAARTVNGEPAQATVDLAAFLQPNFLAVMDGLTRLYLNQSEATSEKLRGVRALSKLIELMSGSLSAYQPKILATLKLLLSMDALCEASLDVWQTYFRSVDMKLIGPLLCQIVADLLPHVEAHPRVANLLNDLIETNKRVLHHHLVELQAMPIIPALDRALKAIRHVVKSDIKGPQTSEQLSATIEQLTVSIAHESVSVRVMGLKQLLTMLRERTDVMQLMNRDRADRSISMLVRTLLLRCLDTNRQTQLLTSACLGELSAVDPSRLDISLAADTSRRVDRELPSNELGRELIRRFLVKALQSADTKAQDRAAFAVQEMLKQLGCSAKTPALMDASVLSTDFGVANWRALGSEVQAAIAPFLTTQYATEATTRRVKHDVDPMQTIFQRQPSFVRWILEWERALMDAAVTPLLKTCRGVVKDDINMALFILPYLIQHVVTHGSAEQRAAVQREILAVIKGREDGGDVGVRQLQTVFTVLDTLSQWTERRAEALSAQRASHRAPMAPTITGPDTVSLLLGEIPRPLLAQAAIRSDAWARALMYLESHVRTTMQTKHSAIEQTDVKELYTIYGNLNEPDGLDGFMKLRTETTPLDEMHDRENRGDWAQALTCYDSALQKDPHNLLYQLGLLKCWRNLGHLQTMLSHIDGIIAPNDTAVAHLQAAAVGAAWRLGNWEKVRVASARANSNDFEVAVGRALLALHDKRFHEVGEIVERTRREVLVPLGAASMESYQRAYPYVAQLHMLAELEQATTRLAAGQSPPSMWEARLKVTQPSERIREPILTLRRVLCSLFPHSSDYEGTCALQLARELRKVALYAPADAALLQATLRQVDTTVEAAKLLRAQGNSAGALRVLKDATGAKIRLLEAQLKEDAAEQQRVVTLAYESAVKASHSTLTLRSKAHFLLGRFYERLMRAAAKTSPYSHLEKVIEHYGASLRYGHKHIFQALPRLLSLWFDFGAHHSSADTRKPIKRGRDDTSQPDYDRVMQAMETFINELPPYVWMMALPQLVSRICHRNGDVQKKLTALLITLLTTFPNQAYWGLAPIHKSQVQARREKAVSVFQAALRKDPIVAQALQKANTLIDGFIHLAKDAPVEDRPRTVKMHELHRDSQLNRFVPVQLVVPRQTSLAVNVPTGPPSARHDAFNSSDPCIQGFSDDVQVLPSLQKPRKIAIIGSDGAHYSFLCKSRDDLRKDARMMEFFNVVNKLLRHSADARRRNLAIRTYAVMPLNEDCGMIEWVNNTHVFKNIVNKLLEQKGKTVKPLEIKAIYKSQDILPLTRYQTMLSRQPPVFAEWFMKIFPEPSSWFEGRMTYAHTTAVMSVIGAMVGLGDRHMENILFDSTDGAAVHVDFSCLFWKGLELREPELVPFRLTSNMIDGLGVTGQEGVYRTVCEIVMGELRSNREMLLSVLDTFIHDPLVEWTKKNSADKQTADKAAARAVEVENQQATNTMNHIELRLLGHVDVGDPRKRIMSDLPLSVSGQVHALISAAMSEEFLSQMYIGWTSWL
eukprot:TRINITY_DN4193_c0_g1_i1.p1 TRINITY_DN4193_c0_g1~~TRINITY_DN4193_c0_g1_i1.p1  ORF type:complete len:1800 (-),score=472.86 TRINITY_DN4193_c0_g1_i1:48-5345(-)